MLPSKVGTWRIECLIGEHLQAGMSTLFLVYSNGEWHWALDHFPPASKGGLCQELHTSSQPLPNLK